MEKKLTAKQKEDLKAMMTLPKEARNTLTVLAAGMMLGTKISTQENKTK